MLSSLREMEKSVLFAKSAKPLTRFYGWNSLETAFPVMCLICGSFCLLCWLWDCQSAHLRYSKVLSEYEKKLKWQNSRQKIPISTHNALLRQEKLKQMIFQRCKIDFVSALLALVSIVLVLSQLRSVWEANLWEMQQKQLQKGHQMDPELVPDSAWLSLMDLPGQTYNLFLVLITCALLKQIHTRYVLKMEIFRASPRIPNQKKQISISILSGTTRTHSMAFSIGNHSKLHTFGHFLWTSSSFDSTRIPQSN